jgi:RimJ/RimL family protein N-acetyltransferase
MDLQSIRISIRPWQRYDEDVANEWPPYNDPFESLWNLPRQLTADDYWFNGFDSNSTRRTWAVEDLPGRLVGRISLREVDERKGRARLGITFGAPFVGKGLGTEALRIFLDYYFTDLGFQIMVLDVAALNLRAVRCYERLGFRYVGSDWRSVGMFFDARVLDDPRYAPMRRFFRPNQRGSGLEVEFLEMELPKEKWLLSDR